MENENQSPDFQKRKVDQPILNSELRQKLTPSPQKFVPYEEGGFKGFYKANKIYFWAIILGAAVISVLAFFAFRSGPPPVLEEANINISIDAPETAASGGEVVYRISVENNDSSNLAGLGLEVTYPEGVSYLSSSPNAQNLSGTLFGIPDLASGQNATIFLKTRATGNINDEKELKLKLRYRYDNFSSEFAKEARDTIRLAASDVLFEISGPQSSNNAQLVVYSIKFRNDSDKDIENARIAVTYPEGFEFAAATPEPALGNNTWNVELLPQNEEAEIQVQGSFKGVAPGESKIAKAEFLIFGTDGRFFTQSVSEFITQIGSSPLVVFQELDGSSGLVVDPGQNLRYTITYSNNASVPATSVNILATVDSSTVDLSSLRAQGGQISGNTILWNASTISRLNSLNPNESGELFFNVEVKDPATQNSSKDLQVITNVKINSDQYGDYFPGNELSLKISSPSEIKGELSFVSGFLPPQVGRSTVYRVKLSLFNSSNDFSDAVVTAFIPLAGEGFNNASVSGPEKDNVEFDASTGKLTWRAGSLAAHTGRFVQAKTLQFELTFSPSEAQKFTSPTLVKDIRLNAKDNFTGQNIDESTGNITTNSLSGENSYGKGTVQP